jgi:hypothetical protein
MTFWVYAQAQAGAPLLAAGPGTFNAPARLLQITAAVPVPQIQPGQNYFIWSNANQQGQPDQGNCLNVTGLVYSFAIS